MWILFFNTNNYFCIWTYKLKTFYKNLRNTPKDTRQKIMPTSICLVQNSKPVHPLHDESSLMENTSDKPDNLRGSMRAQRIKVSKFWIFLNIDPNLRKRKLMATYWTFEVSTGSLRHKKASHSTKLRSNPRTHV